MLLVYSRNKEIYTLNDFIFRSTPIECLHTILLGPYKYLLHITMQKVSQQHKKEILARISVFDYSGFERRLTGNVCRYHKSFVGRDYKLWAQMAVFILEPYLEQEELDVWLKLSHVSQYLYMNIL